MWDRYFSRSAFFEKMVKNKKFEKWIFWKIFRFLIEKPGKTEKKQKIFSAAVRRAESARRTRCRGPSRSLPKKVRKIFWKWLRQQKKEQHWFFMLFQKEEKCFRPFFIFVLTHFNMIIRHTKRRDKKEERTKKKAERRRKRNRKKRRNNKKERREAEEKERNWRRMRRRISLRKNIWLSHPGFWSSELFKFFQNFN